MSISSNKPGKLLFRLVYLLVLIVLVEGTGHLAYRITQGKWLSSSELKQQRRGILEKLALRDQRLAAEIGRKPDGRSSWSVEIVHPYIGYVVDFHDKLCGSIGFCDDRIRSYRQAFPGDNFVAKTADSFIVALTGGSFAYGVGNTSSPGKWESMLASVPGVENKTVYFYTLALGGFKQPQQLNTISYLLGMGVEFDLIINIDGFNEIALPASENIAARVNPFFPRVWHHRVGRSKVDGKLERLKGEHAFYQQQQADYATRYQSGWYRNSALANLLWISGNQKFVSKMRDAEIETLKHSEQGNAQVSTLEATGPQFQFADYDDILRKSVAFWSRSSRSMQAVAAAHGIPYFHFLQPNQYLEGSKKMGEEERAVAIMAEHPYTHAASAGYPMLVEEGKKLADSGISFTSLTAIYADNEEILYIDGCCHVNQKGYDYVVEAVVEVVREKYTNSR